MDAPIYVSDKPNFRGLYKLWSDSESQLDQFAGRTGIPKHWKRYKGDTAYFVITKSMATAAIQWGAVPYNDFLVKDFRSRRKAKK